MDPESVPPEFRHPEGDGEAQDPDLVLEATTATLRRQWDEWMCRRGKGTFADITFFGRRIGGVPGPAIDAYRALEQALKSAGYTANSCWAYNCRLIVGTDQPSLHSAGIAVDVDPVHNPFSPGDPFAGRLRAAHVNAVLSIRNGRGARVWSWGGHWATPDRMHFQLDQGPASVDVDWSSVPGGTGSASGRPQEPEEEMVLVKGMDNAAVKRFQECLVAWDSKALPKHGPDGDFGSETVTWVTRFQEAYGLEKTGKIDGVTAALLATHRHA